MQAPAPLFFAAPLQGEIAHKFPCNLVIFFKYVYDKNKANTEGMVDMRGMRRIADKASYAQAREILSRAAYGVLSTTCEDGLPYGVPLCFALSGNSIYFHCAVEGQKLNNLAHDSRVCLTAVAEAENCPARFTMRYRSAMAFGTARIVYGEDERIAALRLLCQKYAPEHGDEGIAAYIQAHIQDTLVVRMEVEYLSGKDTRPMGGQD